MNNDEKALVAATEIMELLNKPIPTAQLKANVSSLNCLRRKIMLKIKDLQRNQRFYAMDSKGEPHSFKVWMYPMEVNGVWTVDCTDSGDYCFTFTEEDEPILFLTEDLT